MRGTLADNRIQENIDFCFSIQNQAKGLSNPFFKVVNQYL
jgi:hypothetical protein